ncbi:MAG: DJ-1/PfpI family protein, partial [Candidatus Thorarchaeota archaeon]
MKRKTSLLIAILTLSICVGLAPTQLTAQNMNDVHVLFVLSDGFGWSYFPAQEYFDNWNVETTTLALGVDTTVRGCYNRPYVEVTADLLLSNFDLNTLNNYDCVFIPAGGNWPNLLASHLVLDLLSAAHARGLLVTTFCISNVVVAGASNVVTGLKVASFDMSNLEMSQAGAIIVVGPRIVCDNHVITGSEGGGPTGGGYTTAPIYEACAMVVKMALGRSWIESAYVTPMGNSYSITVTTTDPATLLPGINSTTITTVRAQVYFQADPITPVATIDLTDSDTDGTYTGELSGLTGGPFRVDIEIQDSDNVLEVVRNISTIFPSAPLIIG